MSLLLLIDGYNVIAPIAPPSGRPDPAWLHRERSRLLRRLIEQLDESVRRRTCVVFDAADPPRDRPPQFEVNEIDVRFAVDYPEADDLLEELIAAHSAPKKLAVISSDHRVQAAAKRRGCTVMESDVWMDQLLEGRVGLAPRRGRPERRGAGQGSELKRKPTANDDDVDDWMREFGF